jgi:D-beta-D-heptose 7-phosphate kinase / D-beta-D-heptose 1-phosphate adenosyltransferase
MSNSDGRSIEECLAEFRKRRVLVLGDAILDEYLVGECSRISPEAPVPVVRVTGSRQVLGGAANTAANVVSLGGNAALIAFVGDDQAGAFLRRCASTAGMDLVGIDAGKTTLRKTRVVGQHQQIVRLDYEEVQPLTQSVEADVLAAFDKSIGDADIVVISDYAKGFISPRIAGEIIRRARNANREVVVDPRPQNRDCYVGCDYVTPNWREARGLLGWPDAEPSADAVAEVGEALVATLGCHVVLTLGPHGIAFSGRGGREHFTLPTLAREVFDVSGAGDTVVAAFALARAVGADHQTAVTLANKAASVVVGKFGTATVTPEEILHGAKAVRLVTRQALRPLADRLRAEGRRIVTVNGAFDILHAGHLHMLGEARRQGDVLIVGLNSDASVRSYKGNNRPIVSQQQRAEMLLALRLVDVVHIFDEPNPIAFIEQVMPDVHVNGSEYGEDCIEREAVERAGGRIYIVQRLPGLSSSALLTASASRAET